MEQQQIFRQKSLDRISSPEQLHDYIKVTSPRLWMLLTVIIVLVAGIVVAACVISLENTMAVQVYVTDGQDAQAAGDTGDPDIYITMPLDQKDKIGIGMAVRFADTEGTISYIYESEKEIRASIKPDKSGKKLPAGQYEGELVIESATPISFLLN